jgi:DNA-binding MarR family transcriptional regulator
MSIGELARSERVGAPAMTKTVGVLETEGLARRVRDAEDGRVVRVEATADGRAFVLRGRDQRVARIGQALSALDRTDTTRLEAAIGALERLVADLENTSASSSPAPRARARARR